MPEDARPDEPFQAVGTFIQGKDGRIKLVEIDGASLEEMEEETDDEVEEAEAVEAGETSIDSAMKRAMAMGALEEP